ncbi:MAG: hypothetical protein KDB23_30240, partial [Planctomycetales bacterium]|nr:hypothetical protein [Planctomycetales bacterium]
MNDSSHSSERSAADLPPDDTASPVQGDEQLTQPPADPLAHIASDSNSAGSSAVIPGDATVISKRPPLPTAVSREGIGSRELGQTLVGRKLAHFHLSEFVGGGGMGAVFRATDTMLNRTVAVKVLSRDQGQDEETVRRFQNEAQSAARLDHENIARVYY